ncbi:MAG TPA: DUF429 domain-containing protein [Mycobacteriales bacterium]|jgi:predicted RNase H-like nuclease|nr:DUF429 domain-containing protein [Mycobacteriales bacterium]
MLRSVAVLGVDGCPGGWVGAEVTGRRVRWHFAAGGAVAELLERDVDAVGIDMPIGLPAAGTRPCDRAARRQLGRARSSAFFAPPRAVLTAATHAEAVTMARDRGAPGLSIQAWHIVARITEVDRWISPPRQRKVVEVHPELSFRRLDPRVVEPKRTARGAGQRIRALTGPYEVGDLAELPPGVPLADALDALAAAWSADRHRTGAAAVLGGDREATGLRMEIRV